MKKKIAERIDLSSPEYYFNRELSFIEFNRRVLDEAVGNKHPLLERLKFCTIFSSNLDEFFMIRVAGLKSQISADVVDLSYDGRTPSEQLKEIRNQLLPLYEKQQDLLGNEIIPALEKEGVVIHQFSTLSEKEKEYLRKYFIDCVLPVLTPLLLDQAHPFPRIINRSLNVAFVIKDRANGKSETKISFLQLPNSLPRFVNIERKSGHHFVLLEQIIKAFAELLYPGMDVIESNTFRVTRDADVEIAEDEADDLLSEIAEQIKHRRWGRAAVRLEVSANMPKYLVDLLKNALDLEEIDVYTHSRPLNLPDYMELSKLDIRRLKDKPFQTKIIKDFNSKSISIFDAIKERDYMVHHPYDSFSSNTLKFISEASQDPDVVAIKMTLYRTGMNSPIVKALKFAAENGKEVTAFVELKARFDEENNIIWARELEKVGVHVIYGVIGLKTHCKVALVVRKEANKLKTYLHMSSGNYNHSTAKLYTDLAIFTARDEFRLDATHLFNYLTGYSRYEDWEEFIVAPVNLYPRIMELIEREIEKHTPENPGMIFVKINSLVHRAVIPALYRASQAGVKVKLIIRGICCLKPGVPGISENIEVRSVIGRFLEHSRIFYFKNGGDEEYYLSSADWMSRNLHKRVELMFPIYDELNKTKLWDILNLYWSDNYKSWELQTSGEYKKVEKLENEPYFSAQDYFLDEIKLQRENI